MLLRISSRRKTSKVSPIFPSVLYKLCLVRQELAKEKELRAAIEADYATFKDREAFLKKELEEFKKTRADLTKRHEIASRERSQTINVIRVLRGFFAYLFFRKWNAKLMRPG